MNEIDKSGRTIGAHEAKVDNFRAQYNELLAENSRDKVLGTRTEDQRDENRKARYDLLNKEIARLQYVAESGGRGYGYERDQHELQRLIAARDKLAPRVREIGLANNVPDRVELVDVPDLDARVSSIERTLNKVTTTENTLKTTFKKAPDVRDTTPHIYEQRYIPQDGQIIHAGSVTATGETADSLEINDHRVNVNVNLTRTTQNNSEFKTTDRVVRPLPPVRPNPNPNPNPNPQPGGEDGTYHHIDASIEDGPSLHDGSRSDVETQISSELLEGSTTIDQGLVKKVNLVDEGVQTDLPPTTTTNEIIVHRYEQGPDNIINIPGRVLPPPAPGPNPVPPPGPTPGPSGTTLEPSTPLHFGKQYTNPPPGLRISQTDTSIDIPDNNDTTPPPSPTPTPRPNLTPRIHTTEIIDIPPVSPEPTPEPSPSPSPTPTPRPNPQPNK